MSVKWALVSASLIIGLLTPYAAHAVSDDEIVNKIAQDYADEVGKHDVPGWAALFTQDAILVPVGAPIMEGHDNIVKWGEGASKIYNHLAITNQLVRRQNSLIWDAGNYVANINLPNGQKTDVTGTYLLVLEQAGDKWLIKANSWNINPPPMPAAK